MSNPTRRAVLAGAAATVACGAWSKTMPETVRLPALYIPHGGGPWPWMGPNAFAGPGAWDALRRYLVGLPAGLPERPKAILSVTAHWEEAIATVSTAAKPPMYYDYYGFPPETYEIVWPAPGDPALAARVRALLGEAGIETGEDPKRGFDHGTFVPLAVAWPGAEVPVVQLSLVKGLDPAVHLAIGRALAPLRDEGVLIVGSGMSYHNMRGFNTAQGATAAEAFDRWLGDTVRQPAAERDGLLLRWAEAPSGRACHPREEHLLPLMVIAGAAGADAGSVPFSERVIGTRVSAVHFGA